MEPWVWWLIFSLGSAVGSNEPKIHKGRFARKGEFPYAIYVLRMDDKNIESCGGILATLSKIISAGHCFMTPELELREVSQYTIVGGTVEAVKVEDGRQERKLIKIQVHDKYSVRVHAKSLYHDIAVAELNEPFKESSSLSVMKLASSNEKDNKQAWEDFVKTGKPCTAVGWGATESQTHSDTLKTVDLKVWTDEECSKMVFPGDDDLTGKGDICLSGLKSGEQTSFGDSGSPLICDGYVWALSRSGTSTRENYLLLWPYLDYFGLSNSAAAANSANSTASYDLKPSLLCLTAIITTSRL